MKRLIALLLGLGVIATGGTALAATNVNTIDVSTNINWGASDCASEYPQSPSADVSTWRITAAVTGLMEDSDSYLQPAGYPCFASSNAGPFSNGKHLWINCFTTDAYYGGVGTMWLGVTEYRAGTSTAYATFWPAGLQTQTNIAAQGVPACKVNGNIVSPTGR